MPLDIVVSTTNDDVNCNVCHGKNTIKKARYLCVSIATIGNPFILTIEGQWLKVVVHMSIQLIFLFYHVYMLKSLSKPNYEENSSYFPLLNLWFLRNTLNKWFFNLNHLLI
jgi:hypothetical protein